MIQRDYVLRQIQQLVQVFASVLHLKTQRLLKEAMLEINNGLTAALGRGVKDLLEMKEDELLELCTSDNRVNHELVLVIAELLQEQGNLKSEQGDLFEANRSFQVSLGLYEYLAGAGGEVPLDIFDRITNLKASIDSE